MNEDSINLLKECYSGCTMAINSINQIQEFVKDDSLLALLEEYKNEHEHLKEQSCEFLKKAGENGKTPPVMASAFSWITAEMKLLIKNDNTHIAKLMMDGCNMGIQSIGEFLNKYHNACDNAIKLAKEVIRSEEEFNKKMENFL